MKLRPKFSLRTLFVAIAAIALLTELIAWPMRQAQREQLRRRHVYDTKHAALFPTVPIIQSQYPSAEQSSMSSLKPYTCPPFSDVSNSSGVK